MDTTVAGEALMYFTTAAKPPLRALFKPLPKETVYHHMVCRQHGRYKLGGHFVEVHTGTSASRSLFVSQSGESVPFVLKRYTSSR